MKSDMPRTDEILISCPSHLQEAALANLSQQLERELAASKAEVDLLKKGKVFVDPKWIYNLETQLAKAHEELCQAGLRDYGN